MTFIKKGSFFTAFFYNQIFEKNKILNYYLE